MAFLIYGTLETPIAVDEFFIRCPSCEKDSPADAMIVSRYFHLYYIPIYPMGKEANIICKQCGIKRYGLPFDADLISNYEEVKMKFKNPLFTYLGVILIASLVFLLILSKILN